MEWLRCPLHCTWQQAALDISLDMTISTAHLFVLLTLPVNRGRARVV